MLSFQFTSNRTDLSSYMSIYRLDQYVKINKIKLGINETVLINFKYCLHYLVNVVNDCDILILMLSTADINFFSFGLTPCFLINSFYVIEIYFKLFTDFSTVKASDDCEDNKYYMSPLFLFGVVGRLFIPFLNFEDSILRKLLLFIRAMRCSRKINLSKDLHNLYMAIIDIFPTVVETFLLFFLLTYIFGVIGYQLFGSSFPQWYCRYYGHLNILLQFCVFFVLLVMN